MTWDDAIWLSILVARMALGAVTVFFAELSRMCMLWLGALCLACCAFWCYVRIHLTPIHFIWHAQLGCWSMVQAIKKKAKENTDNLFIRTLWKGDSLGWPLAGVHLGEGGGGTTGRPGVGNAAATDLWCVPWPRAWPKVKPDCRSNLWSLSLGCSANRRVGWLDRFLICWGVYARQVLRTQGEHRPRCLHLRDAPDPWDHARSPQAPSISPKTEERRQLLESLGNLSSAARMFQ